MAVSAASAKLAKYRSKRDFSRTTEPKGQAGAASGHRFVIQQHAARRMHYDFRLELDGVLLSWSVPKGPSLSPRDRRLAVRTEDHPIDYADFEGVIPKGEYGGGTVVVWDRGTWQPDGDARDGMANGKLTFALHGEKLHGRWHLVRTRGIRGSSDRAENWLLFKGRDDAANERIDIVASQPASVVSGRTVEEIAAAPDRIWHSNKQSNPHAAASAATAASDADRRDVLALVEQLPLGFPLSNLDKVLYPEQGITKGELIGYLTVVADHALPHVANRPLTLVRCPEGIAQRGRARACFFQKHILPGAPPAVEAVSIVEDSGETADYMTVHDAAGMAALAQLGTLEIHTWGCHADQPEQPDLIVFDLDPDVGLGWEAVALAAFELRRRLHDVGLDSFVKTTGGKGLHVVAPTARGPGWDDFKAFTKAVVEAMERDEPDRYTTNPLKARRKGKIFLDYLRNGRGATFIAPYSPRARARAPVAVPISWDELAHGVDPATFTTVTVPRRLVTLPTDPWSDMARLEQSITAAAWRAVGLAPPARGHKPTHKPGPKIGPRPGHKTDHKARRARR
ncbi:MAG TPA: non-homologous end-joining DNA ligase [Kofleriaceae bacterium]|jgi:bifunctional non-homologous end joining protein LigD|nr:non-homologous end-joining DNA ligase [Kofleriaceae bacterium]